MYFSSFYVSYMGFVTFKCDLILKKDGNIQYISKRDNKNNPNTLKL